MMEGYIYVDPPRADRSSGAGMASARPRICFGTLPPKKAWREAATSERKNEK